MRAGYVIVGALWATCTAWFLAMGFADDIASAAIGGLVASALLALPVAFVAAGVWRSVRALMGAARRRRARG